MEHNDTKITRKEVIQVCFGILLTITVGVLLFTVIIVIKNLEEIKSDPIEYAIKNTPIDSCTCFNDKGQSHFYSAEGVKEVVYPLDLNNIKLVREK